MDIKQLNELTFEANGEVNNLSIATVKKLFSKVDKIEFVDDEEMRIYMKALKADFDMFFNFEVMKYINNHKRK